MQDEKRVVILALDGVYGKQKMIDTISTVMDGPMEPFMAYVKLNDGLHDRDGGPNVVDAILGKYNGLGVFTDIKGFDVLGTIENICTRYGEAVSRMLMTISVHSDVGVFKELALQHSNLRVAAMVVPTDISEEDFQYRYDMIPASAMQKWYGRLTDLYRRKCEMPEAYPTELMIASKDMLRTVIENFPGVKPITPGVRDAWMVDPDHQKRTTGIYKALLAGSRYAVMGAQLLKGATGISAEESRAKTAAEITTYLNILCHED